MSAVTSRKPGRLFFANPGPTNIPDSVLKAMSHHTVDFMDADFIALYQACVEGVKRILRTQQTVFFYTGSGPAAWEASLSNLLSPGDTILVPETVMAAVPAGISRKVGAAWRRGWACRCRVSPVTGTWGRTSLPSVRPWLRIPPM